MKLKIYQTIRYYPEQTEEAIKVGGPIHCNDELAWLGKGHCFWDTSLENAHWWGQVHYQNQYVVCQAEMDFNWDTCFDLLGCVAHRAWFMEQIQLVKAQLGPQTPVPIAQVLEMLFAIPEFNFGAIRANGLPVADRPPIESVFPQGRYGIDLYNRTQICIRNLQKVNFRNFHVLAKVYP